MLTVDRIQELARPLLESECLKHTVTLAIVAECMVQLYYMARCSMPQTWDELAKSFATWESYHNPMETEQDVKKQVNDFMEAVLD